MLINLVPAKTEREAKYSQKRTPSAGLPEWRHYLQKRALSFIDKNHTFVMQYKLITD